MILPREVQVPVLRFVSPERRWRAAFMVLPAAFFGWRVYLHFGLFAGCLVAAVIATFAVPIMGTCLIVTAEGLSERRLLRTVQVPWGRISELRVGRPGGLWGGMCVVAECSDGGQVDLLSTRAYTRVPSAHHVDELHQICWTLEERLMTYRQNLPSGP
jgi:hypothetical protein